MIEHVVIIGGGFAGTLQAINLLRHDGPVATLIERRAQAGEGVAYGDADAAHVLNVRAANMSAFPDRPDHFVAWLADSGHDADPSAFVQRVVYGQYLRSLLRAACAAQPNRLRIVHDAATDLSLTGETISVELESGAALEADAAVLAVGNLPPHTPPGIDPDALPAHLYLGDPWHGDPAEKLGPEDHVLILGTGLTMVDMVLKLRRHGFRGRITAMSRRGLAPKRHAAQANFEPIGVRPPATASRLVRAVRARADQVGWRNAVDELRPFTQSLWRAASEAGRRRFVRHLRPWWDIHRHRIAPEIAEALDEDLRTGRLAIIAGKLASATPSPDGGIAVSFRPRGDAELRETGFSRIINCTGPQGDLRRTDEPLLRTLAERGVLRPDRARLGIDVDAQSRVVSAGGRTSDHLLAIGPMTRGAFWEIVAVPDIRVQTWRVARRLSNAHWVGGEGL